MARTRKLLRREADRSGDDDDGEDWREERKRTFEEEKGKFVCHHAALCTVVDRRLWTLSSVLLLYTHCRSFPICIICSTAHDTCCILRQLLFVAIYPYFHSFTLTLSHTQLRRIPTRRYLDRLNCCMYKIIRKRSRQCTVALSVDSHYFDIQPCPRLPQPLQNSADKVPSEREGAEAMLVTVLNVTALLTAAFLAKEKRVGPLLSFHFVHIPSPRSLFLIFI